jgi:hypothetical protein
MASPHIRQRISRFAVGTAGALAALSWATVAMASQGPGVATGTASHFIQLAMAIIVWGASALLVGIGLIGAARRRMR